MSSNLNLKRPAGKAGSGELRAVIAMIIPVVITTSSRALMDVADYVMVTMLGIEAAAAAILPSQMLTWSYLCVGMGVASIVTTFASQAMGRGDNARCGSCAWQMLYLSAIFGAIGVALIPLLRWGIAAIGHAPEVQAMEFAYARVALFSAAPTIASNGLGHFFIGVHKPWITMWSALEANLVNIVISAALMFGFFGIEPMGIEGAAWGTFAANVYRTLRLLVSALGPQIDAVFHTRSGWRPSLREMLALLRVGLPCGLQWLSEVTVWTIFVTVLVGTKFGTVALIATNASWQYMRIAFMPALGVGMALSSLVGKAIGAGDPDLAVRHTRSAVLLTLVYMGGLSVLYLAAGGPLIGLFSDNEEVIRIGARVMICAGIFQLFDALGINYTFALRGAGDTFWPSIFFVASTWSIIIGGGYAMTWFFPGLGSIGPWIASSTLIIVTALFLWWRWRGGAWRRINLLGPPSEAPAAATRMAEQMATE